MLTASSRPSPATLTVASTPPVFVIITVTEKGAPPATVGPSTAAVTWGSATSAASSTLTPGTLAWNRVVPVLPGATVVASKGYTPAAGTVNGPSV